MDRSINSPGHGKNVVYGLNSAENLYFKYLVPHHFGGSFS